MRVSVIGGGTVPTDIYRTAVEVGRLLGTHGHTVICGGLTGVMEGVCQGAQETGGETIGILPGIDPTNANRYCETVIATGLGHARNVLVVLNSDAVIAINGESGTLSEIGHALTLDRPIAGLNTHAIDGVHEVPSPREAVEYVESTINTRSVE